jgi:hypothetical protein
MSDTPAPKRIGQLTRPPRSVSISISMNRTFDGARYDPGVAVKPVGVPQQG